MLRLVHNIQLAAGLRHALLGAGCGSCCRCCLLASPRGKSRTRPPASPSVASPCPPLRTPVLSLIILSSSRYDHLHLNRAHVHLRLFPTSPACFSMPAASPSVECRRAWFIPAPPHLPCLKHLHQTSEAITQVNCHCLLGSRPLDLEIHLMLGDHCPVTHPVQTSSLSVVA